MKQIRNNLIIASLILFATLTVIVSCDDMNEIQREYADKEERVYLGKVDSIKSIPGFGRSKITWYIGTDPKIEQTIIYWNQREDSIVKNFVRHTTGVQKDSIIIENLPEGSTLFEFRNVNSRGETSLFSSAAVTAWGPDFAFGLPGRRLTSTLFDYENSEFALKFSPTVKGDSVVYTQILYTDNTGSGKEIIIDRITNDTTLTGFSDGKEFKFRNVFFLPQGLDTVFGEYEVIISPTAVFDSGRKISFAGNPGSRYSEHSPISFYEWNPQGDLILYELNGEGLFVQVESYPGLVSRDTYRDFFFYDDDKFIGINKSNQVFMFRIENSELIFVKKTPTSTNYFGSGFTQPLFVPAKGFFFGIDAAGVMKTYFANNDASWGSPNGVTVATGVNYTPITLFNYQYLIGVNTEGYLLDFPISTIGTIKGMNIIGSGWNRFVKFFTVGSKLIAIDAIGDFYEFDFNTIGKYWVVNNPG